jgi:tight adherence protein C
LLDTTSERVIGQAVIYGVVAGGMAWGITVVVGGAIWNVIPAGAAAFVAFQVPGWSVRGAAARRIRHITRRLPHALEIIALVTDSGATFEEALGILVREDPGCPLHEEFDRALRDMHLGIKRGEALRAMADRVGTEDIGAWVTALEVSESLGAPLAHTMGMQAEAIRTRRLQRGERLAREAGPKMAVPNTMIMVANVLLIVGPFLPKLTAIGGL